MRGMARSAVIANSALMKQNAETREDEPIRIYICADSPRAEENLVRVLGAQKKWEVVLENPSNDGDPKRAHGTQGITRREVMVMVAKDTAAEAASRTHEWKSAKPELAVLLLGERLKDSDFLLYVRAGIRGFLPLDATAAELTNAVETIADGGVVCGSAQCAVLFRYFAQEAELFPSAALHRDLGLTRREQQLIPLLTRGLTNKEIASHFSLAEQTVKNHLYRMKKKIGAHGRLEIVDVCRQHGFLPDSV
ncbi:MAG: two-component system response regulator DevR [Candidatus Acidiferrum sp.]